MTPIKIEQHFPWYIDSTDTDNIDCQCGEACDGIAGWATHITNTLAKGDTMTDTDYLAAIADAAENFLKEWDNIYLANDLGDRLSCSEANTLAELLTALGRPEAGRRWIIGHSISDDCADEHCTCATCAPMITNHPHHEWTDESDRRTADAIAKSIGNRCD